MANGQCIQIKDSDDNELYPITKPEYVVDSSGNNIYDLIESAIPDSPVVVDDKLSVDSTNPVQNKVITEKLNEKASMSEVMDIIEQAITITLNTEV